MYLRFKLLVWQNKQYDDFTLNFLQIVIGIIYYFLTFCGTKDDSINQENKRRIIW